MSVKITHRGNFNNSMKFLGRMKTRQQFARLAKYGPQGVAALKAATPVDSSETADSWYFEIVDKPGYYAIHWLNSHMEDGVSIAAIIQYGHGTRTGGYVRGLNYINPAMQPIFKQMADDMWKEVTK